MIVVISAAAEADLETIGDHIALDSPTRALSFVRELREKCLTLADDAHIFPVLPRFSRQGVRRRVAGMYLIFYRIAPDAIEVLRVLHGARDFDAILLDRP